MTCLLCSSSCFHRPLIIQVIGLTCYHNGTGVMEEGFRDIGLDLVGYRSGRAYMCLCCCWCDVLNLLLIFNYEDGYSY